MFNLSQIVSTLKCYCDFKMGTKRTAGSERNCTVTVKMMQRSQILTLIKQREVSSSTSASNEVACYLATPVATIPINFPQRTRTTRLLVKCASKLLEEVLNQFTWALGPVFKCTNTEKGLFSRHNFFLMFWYLNVSLNDLPVLSTNHLIYMLCSHAQLNKGSNGTYLFPLKALGKSAAKVTCQYCYTLTSDNTLMSSK